MRRSSGAVCGGMACSTVMNGVSSLHSGSACAGAELPSAAPVSASLRSGRRVSGADPPGVPLRFGRVPSATPHALRASCGYRRSVRTDLGPRPGGPLVRMPGVFVAPTLGHRRSYVGLDSPRSERPAPGRAHPRLHRHPGRHPHLPCSAGRPPPRRPPPRRPRARPPPHRRAHPRSRPRPSLRRARAPASDSSAASPSRTTAPGM